MSRAFIDDLQLKAVHSTRDIRVCTASGSKLTPYGLAEVIFQLGEKRFAHTFIVCEDLVRPMILGYDFMQYHRIGTDWTEKGGKMLRQGEEILVEAIDGQTPDPLVKLVQEIRIPARSVAVVRGFVPVTEMVDQAFYDFIMSPLLEQEYPEVIIPTVIHHNNLNCNSKTLQVPILIVNLGEDRLCLPSNYVLGTLQLQDLDINDVIVQSSIDPEAYQQYLRSRDLDMNKMIVSPADIEIHRRVELPDADITEKERKQLKELCEKYQDIFSTSSADIGHTTLITMDIETGNHPPICQKPYNLPLKHTDWVRGELELLEKAGIIIRSMSPWASPIVIVPKKSAPDEPPRRRMCIDYRALNSLLPPVKKAYSNAKGVLTLVPLPKIDEIYAKLRGSTVYTSLDLRSGYHNISLSEDSQPKSAFVTPMGKFHFTKVPFGLAQAPAYFQQLINRVLYDLPYTFGYLDDILIFSPNMNTHFAHLEIVFQRLREVNLKLKESKCNFLKRQIQYLGHFISGKGIEPIPEKLEAMKSIPAPRNPKEVKQFLGFVGYYRKFIPRFADISRSLTQLTKKDVPFEWTEQCDKAFHMLQHELLKQPILKYPDPAKPYIMFTDASKYAWACVLTQPYEEEIDGVMMTVNHPISYQSGLFKGSQINWAALTKEAYAIYMAVKKLIFFLADGGVLVYTDHKPLLKFMEKATLNAKVNNWAVEIHGAVRLEIQHIEGIKNTLADTLSRLIEFSPESQQEAEPEGYEYGYCIFEELPPITSVIDIPYDTAPYLFQEHEPLIEITEVVTDEHQEIKKQLDNAIPTDDLEIQLPLTPLQIQSLQAKDSKCKQIIKQLHTRPESVHMHYQLKDNILHKYVTQYQQTHLAMVLPQALIPNIMKMAHDDLGHNGVTRTHMALKKLYYWKGMKKDINKYIRSCNTCQHRNQQVVKYASLHFDVPSLPMQFISMDLIGEFHPPSAKGNRFALTVICMFTGYTFCVPIKNKTATEVAQAYIDNVYSLFGGSEKILSDNGTEFKNAFFEQVAKDIGVKQKVYTAPYHPQSNGRIEGFHSFLKACLSKHITPKLQWDDVVPLACAAYNFLPNEHSKESPFFLMFGRDPLLPLNSLLQPQIRYMGNDKGYLSLEALKKIYEIAARNIQKARQRSDKLGYTPPEIKIKPNDLVLVRNHTAGPFAPKYVGEYRVVALNGNQVEVRAVQGHKSHKVHLSDCKQYFPADAVITKLPDITQFGRKTNLRLDPKHIPDLQWQIPEISFLHENPLDIAQEMCTYAFCTTTMHISQPCMAHTLVTSSLTPRMQISSSM